MAESNANLKIKVTEITSLMQDLQKEIQQIGAEGKGVVEIFNKLGKPIQDQVKNIDEWSKKIAEAKAQIIKFLKEQEASGKAEEQTTLQQQRALKQLIGLENELQRNKRQVLGEIENIGKEEARIRSLKQKSFEEQFNADAKAKAANQEISAGESEIARIIREQAENKARLAVLVEEEKEKIKQAAAEEKENAKLKAASLKEQRDLEQFMLEKSLKAQADKAKAEEDGIKRAEEARKRAYEQEKQAALQQIEDSKKIALAEAKAGLEKVRASKLTIRNKRALEEKYWNDILAIYPKDSKEYIDNEAAKTRALAKYEKQRDDIIKKYRNSRPKEQKAAEKEASVESRSFLSEFKRGFGDSSLGRILGRFAGVTAAIQVFRKALQFAKQVIVESFKASVDYEAQLAQLQAVTGVTNAELQELSKSVLDVAGSTTFTSEEIVKLQTELGKLGFDPSQIIAATEGIARTAQALGEQVGPVAQKVGQILKQYGLQAEETARVSDILVSTINSSALSFDGFGTAIQYIGPLAASAGSDFKDTASAMAILADNGFTASRIGTGLRGILTELSKTGKDLNTVIRELADGEISFSQAVDLVGKRNAAQLITLVDNVDALEDLNDKYYQAGSAAIASAQQIDTYKGNLQLLQSALNRVSISFGNLIKNSKLLRVALKLVDEEGYNSAKAAEQLSEANRYVYADALEESAEFLGKMEKNGEDIIAASAKQAEEVIKKSIVNPLIDEYIKAGEEMDRINVRMFGTERAVGAQLNTLYKDEQYKALKERRDKIQELLGETNALGVSQTPLQDVKFGVDEEGVRVVKSYSYNLTAILEKLKQSTEAVREQLDDLSLQNRLSEERNAISEEYSDDLKAQRKLRDDDFKDEIKRAKTQADYNKIEKDRINTLREGVEFNKRQEAQVLAIKERITEEEAKLENLTGRDRIAQQARIDQLKQEVKNYNNLVYSRDELYAIAQKEYELEFKNLANKVASEKDALASREKEIRLRIQTLNNEIEGTKNKEKQKDLIGQQIALQNELLNIQDKSRLTINQYIDEVDEKLQDQRKLWQSQGYDLRLLDKAIERLEQFKIMAEEMKIDFPEFEAAAQDLAKSFEKQFGRKLKLGIKLSEKDKQQISTDMTAFFAKFGENLTDSQKKLIEDFILSGLITDPKDIKNLRDKLIQDLFGKLADALKQYNDTALENTRNRLRSELDEIRNRYNVEEEILKSNLNNQLITESQYRAKSGELKKKQLQEENEINKKIFEAEKKSDMNDVVIETSEALASNILQNYTGADSATASIYTVLGTAAIIAAGAAKMDAIRRRKFFPVKYEEGGFVEGPSHAQGGVPFTVQGQGGYEMEGGEFIVNKKAAQFHRSLLERINGSVKPNTSVAPLKFAQGGIIKPVMTQSAPQQAATESVNYLKAIAQATTTAAINSNKPVRAFVASRDLSKSENERRLRERNDRI